jgi:hypothetical protein
MSSQVLPSVRRRVPLRRRVGAVAAVALARILATRSPDRIRMVLTALRRGARPADPDRALAAHDAVQAVSTRCSGEYCLQRSLAIVLLCRLSGTWPTWCVGVRPDPFGAHAWVEAGGRPVGEPFGPGHYRPMMTVPPATPPADGAP